MDDTAYIGWSSGDDSGIYMTIVIHDTGGPYDVFLVAKDIEEDLNDQENNGDPEQRRGREYFVLETDEQFTRCVP